MIKNPDFILTSDGYANIGLNKKYHAGHTVVFTVRIMMTDCMTSRRSGRMFHASCDLQREQIDNPTHSGEIVFISITLCR